MLLPFHSEALDRLTVTRELVSPVAYSEAYSMLGSRALGQHIEAGEITLAMIRPQLEGATTPSYDDSRAAEIIEEHIEGLGIAAKFCITFDQEAVDDFYKGGPKDVQLSLPPEKHLNYPNRWDEFSDLMLSGPTTVLLLLSLGKDAVAMWRSQVGHFDVVNRRDPLTIRGMLATDNYNNLIHGSDSAASVAREVAILQSLIARNS